MKKGKLTLGLVIGLSVVALSSCDALTRNNQGYVLTMTGPDGTIINYTADEFYSQFKTSANGVKQFYDAITEVIIRNEIEKPENAAVKAEIMEKAANKVSGVKETAEDNADTNNTDYDDELDTLLESYSVEDLTELKDYFAYQLMQTEVEDQFYEDNKRELLVGADASGSIPAYQGYLENKLPYHVRHILVKVSSDANAFYDATVTEQEAKNLSSVIKRLAIRKNNETFGDIAREASEDTGSAEQFGDLGIMTKSTSYVNEFKLGVYAYDAIYNEDPSVAANASKLSVPTEASNYLNALGIGEIPYGAALKLEAVSSLVKDSLGNQVNNGKSLYYPRNIYFNKYFNKHNISVIVPEDTDGSAISTVGLGGFQAVAELGGQKVLTDEDGKVILVVRAGSGSSDSGYQGVHFIVVERSALVDTKNGVSLEDYYTTEIPDSADFPQVGGQDAITYVNFMNTTTKVYKERSQTVKDEIKGFDSMLDAHIYEKLANSQQVVIHDAVVREAVENYISVTRAGIAFDAAWNYEQSWKTYTEYLALQEQMRNRLIAETCAVNFANAAAAAEYQVGGICYEKD